MIQQNFLFDTRIGTMKIFVPMTINFKLRNYINKDGLSPVYLHISSKKRRERIPLDLYVNPKYWNNDKQELVGPPQDVSTDNLILKNIDSKITKIKTQYRLSDRVLTVDEFLFEFKNNLSRTNFVSFFSTTLKSRKNTIESSTYEKEMSVWRKLKEFRSEIIFYNIDHQFFSDYRNYLAGLGNKKTTRNGNIKIIKKYLGFAVKAGVKISIDMDDIIAGSTKGNKNYLNAAEIEKCHKYFMADFIPENHKIAMGYFLFSCFTGLRFSDLMNQKREFLLQGQFTFTHVKTKKPQVVKLNKKALELLKDCKDLFVKKYSNDHTRKLVKDICKFLKINKEVDFHMSRHSFGTNWILLGGDVVKLQNLMNHSDLNETMTYVHLAELERNAEADLIDNLF